MDLDQLKYFISIAQTKNFTTAAKSHHISQPAISRRMEQLEREVGCRLLLRSSHKVALTDAGNEFYEYAVSVMGLTDALQQRIDNITKGRTGLVRVSITPTSAHVVRRVLLEFHREYPNIQIELDYHSGKEQIASVGQQKHDFYFTFRNLAEAQGVLETIVTDTDHFKLYVPAEYAYLADPDDLSTMNHVPLLTETRAYAPFYVSRILEICRARGYTSENIITCESFSSMVDFANAGIGFAIFPQAIERSICTDFLASFALTGEDVKNDNVLAWNPDSINDTTVKFLNICKRVFQEQK